MNNNNQQKYALDCDFLKPQPIEANMNVVTDYVFKEIVSNFSFWDAVKELQSKETNLIRNQEEIEVIFYNEQMCDLKFCLLDLMALKHNEELPENVTYNELEAENIQEGLLQGMEIIESLFPELAPYFSKVISFVIVAKMDGFCGGSVSNRIGFIWLSPNSNWFPVDYGEQLFHEFIHNALFLEDMVHNVMPYSADRMDEPDALITSAIRQVKRGYDKAYHAAFVAYGLICYYLKLNLPEKAGTYINPLLKSLEELIQKPQFLSKRGINLLDQLCQNVLQKKTSMQFMEVEQ